MLGESIVSFSILDLLNMMDLGFIRMIVEGYHIEKLMIVILELGCHMMASGADLLVVNFRGGCATADRLAHFRTLNLSGMVDPLMDLE